MAEADMLRMVISLAFIVVIILLGAWLMRRAGWLRVGAGQAIKVVGTHSLGARSSVAIVQVDDIRLVLGVTPQQVTLLHTLPAAKPGPLETSESIENHQASFGHSLRSALARRRNDTNALQP